MSASIARHEHCAWVGIGANLGNPRKQVAQGVAALAEHPGCRLLRQSSLWSSAPHDAPGPDYVNAVAHIATTLDAIDLLDGLQAIENAHYRTRTVQNAPRTLDLDLLLYDTLRLDSARLTLPHPRMHLRAFVLAPLAELEPSLRIPPHGLVTDLLATVSDQPTTRLTDSP